MLDCWSEKARQRPTFSELKSKFDQMLLQSNHYIQFGSYATTKDIPPGYDRLAPPTVGVHNDSPSHNGATHDQHTSHNKAKQSAAKTLSAPLVDVDSGSNTGSGNAAAVLRSASTVIGVPGMLRMAPSNPYVQTPTSIVNSRFQAGGADVRGNGGRKRSGSGGSAKRVIGERKRRVNTETRRTAHLKVAGVNSVQLSVPAEPYDHLETLEDRSGRAGVHV